MLTAQQTAEEARPKHDQAGVTCLVTIHGIGFQQQPKDDLGLPGYADMLHEHLSRYLGSAVLRDDPNRPRERPGQNGPIYVSSNWPPESSDVEEGLKRLGSWKVRALHEIDVQQAPLGDGPLAHVALVYSRLEDRVPRPGSAVQALGRTAFSLSHYASIQAATRVWFEDAWALLHQKKPEPGAGPVSLRVRSDLLSQHHRVLSQMFHRGAPATDTGIGLLETLRTLEDDVCAYVSRNDLRERVRSFVRDALHRLAYRGDVTQIVVNAHSHGTVVAFDVLRELGYAVIPKVRWLVTAGSPLRKYSDLFSWGTEVGCLSQVESWTNFWDARDPVADPLAPPVDWQPGTDPTVAPGTNGMYEALQADGGRLTPVPIEDRLVDNLANSPAGGLQAHNYWDNEQFVSGLGDILKQVIDASPLSPTRLTQLKSGGIEGEH